MLILACDTSGKSCTVALWQRGMLIGKASLNIGLTHSETFMPLLHQLLAETKKKVQEIDVLACGVGPGSFTGIRIGISSIQGLGLALNKPCIPIGSLQALASPYLEIKNVLILPVLDARNQRVFASLYYQGEEILSPIAIEWKALVEKIGQLNLPASTQIMMLADQDTIDTGVLRTFYADLPKEKIIHRLQIIDAEEVARRAEDKIKKIISLLCGKDLVDFPAPMSSFRLEVMAKIQAQYPPEKLLPLYCAVTQAERQRMLRP